MSVPKSPSLPLVFLNAVSQFLSAGLTAACAPADLLEDAPELCPIRADGEAESIGHAVRVAGAQVHRGQFNPDKPDSVFVQDLLQVVPDPDGNLVIVVLNPGSDSRRSELPEALAELRALLPEARVLEWAGEGFLEGGDILTPVKVGNQRLLFVGLRQEAEIPGGPTVRTTSVGIETYRKMVEPLGYKVVVVPFHQTQDDKALHLTTIASFAGINDYGHACVFVDPYHVRETDWSVFYNQGVRVLALNGTDLPRRAYRWAVNVFPIVQSIVIQDYDEIAEALTDGGFSESRLIRISRWEHLVQRDGSVTCCTIYIGEVFATDVHFQFRLSSSQSSDRPDNAALVA